MKKLIKDLESSIRLVTTHCDQPLACSALDAEKARKELQDLAVLIGKVYGPTSAMRDIAGYIRPVEHWSDAQQGRGSDDVERFSLAPARDLYRLMKEGKG